MYLPTDCSATSVLIGHSKACNFVRNAQGTLNFGPGCPDFASGIGGEAAMDVRIKSGIYRDCGGSFRAAPKTLQVGGDGW